MGKQKMARWWRRLRIILVMIDHSEVGAMEEVSVSGDAPLSDTIDLTDSPGPSRCPKEKV